MKQSIRTARVLLEKRMERAKDSRASVMLSRREAEEMLIRFERATERMEVLEGGIVLALFEFRRLGLEQSRTAVKVREARDFVPKLRGQARRLKRPPRPLRPDGDTQRRTCAD